MVIVNTKEDLILEISKGTDLSTIDVSKITDMSGIFEKKIVNYDISNWDVSNVIDMSSMFEKSTFNGDISNWDVSNVKYMISIFEKSSFNGDISNWDVSNVTDMSMAFLGSSFDQDISNWTVSNVMDMEKIFSDSKFTQDISNWNINTDNIFFIDLYPSNKLFTNKYKSIISDDLLLYNNATKLDFPLITTNINSKVLKYKIDDNIGIRKTWTLKNKKYTLDIPQYYLDLTVNEEIMPNYISEDENFYYFEYIQGLNGNNLSSIDKAINIPNLVNELNNSSLKYNDGIIYDNYDPANFVNRNNKLVFVDLNTFLDAFIIKEFI